MIQAKFFESNGKLLGFSISGHAGYAKAGEDIVCAAVSSAVQLTSNIITDGLHKKAVVIGVNNTVKLMLQEYDETSNAVLKMLKIHLKLINEEFPKKIKITTLEV